ncbi:MAG: hypothetical protein BV459_05025 [Thermoplasmata archaeon M11B2D]|nr:MAG: hypothetical protein BV459_05025 [Thermoplasmata archaeon M11B2D]PNX53344.1 MAG: hypothetical protein BV458_04965 [Thermoplasmata archaeon M9B2D]
MTVDYYQCETCKKKTKGTDDKKQPLCCGKPMKKISMDICLQPDHAEHSRPMSDEEPCDDFRGGS